MELAEGVVASSLASTGRADLVAHCVATHPSRHHVHASRVRSCTPSGGAEPYLEMCVAAQEPELPAGQQQHSAEPSTRSSLKCTTLLGCYSH